MHVHPSAIIAEGAELGEGCHVGPFCVVGPQVRLGARCRLRSHAVIEGVTTLGEECELWPHTVVGGAAQSKDRSHAGFSGRLEVGARNRFREGVTINAGSPKGDGVTRIGDDNLFLQGAHVGHDTAIGNNVVMTNVSMLGGHVEIADGAVIGALVGVHQFCRVGRLAMLGGNAAVAQDVPPFALVHGDRARIRGVNVIGLRRNGIDQDGVAAIKRAYRMLFWRTDLLVRRVEDTRRELGHDPLVLELLDFMAETKRGVMVARARPDLTNEPK